MATLPSKFYVGFKSYGDDQLVCFMTPDEGDTNSKKRKETVDRWSTDSSKSQYIDNIPYDGFRIVDTARRSYNNNVVFRIIHPICGAEFEISAENLNELHQECIIEYGEIKTKLLFIREQNTNFLVSETSEKYKEALAETKKQISIKTSPSIKKKDVKEFDRIDLKSQKDVVYLGQHSLKFMCKHNYQNDRKKTTIIENVYLFLYKSYGSTRIKALKSFPVVTEIKGASTDVKSFRDIIPIIDCIEEGNSCTYLHCYNMEFGSTVLSDYGIDVTPCNINTTTYYSEYAMYNNELLMVTRHYNKTDYTMNYHIVISPTGKLTLSEGHYTTAFTLSQHMSIPISQLQFVSFKFKDQ